MTACNQGGDAVNLPQALKPQEVVPDLPADVQRMIETHPAASMAEIAARIFVSRRDRDSSPAGRCDTGNRWYPRDCECSGCCGGIRSPSRGYPWSLLKHCCTLLHVCNVLHVAQNDAKRFLRQVDPQIATRAAGRAQECARLRKQIETGYARALADAGMPQETADAFAHQGAACIAGVKSIPMLKALVSGNGFQLRIKKYLPALYGHISIVLRLAFEPDETEDA